MKTKIMSGLKDRNGQEIGEYDIVEFAFCSDHWHEKCDCPATIMRDVVVCRDGRWLFVDVGLMMTAHAMMHNDYCTVVGNLNDDDCQISGKINKSVFMEIFPSAQ